MKQLLIAVLMSYAYCASAQLPSVITSWEINTDTTGYAGILTNAQAVQYTDSNVYISTTDVASWIPLGYNWPNNPWVPHDQSFVFVLTRFPRANPGTLTATPFGHIGIWKNGVSIYNPEDTKSYNDSNVWMQNAYYFEHLLDQTMDPCLGHPNDHYEYHTHTTPACLYTESDSSIHSPILGYAFDGYPIYGAYGYTNPNTAGAVKRMVSSYQLRTMATRDTLPDGTALTQPYYGPPLDSIPQGAYMQDWEYVAGLGDLDANNGRVCVTPEYPGGTYAYFATLGPDLLPTFPYVLGPAFHGVVHGNAGDLGPNSGHVTVPGTAITYVPDTMATGINQIDVNLSMVVFPNPTSDQLNFRLKTNSIYQHFTGSIYDESGDIIETGDVIPNKDYTYNAVDLAEGVYYLTVRSNCQTYTSKFIVKK